MIDFDDLISLQFKGRADHVRLELDEDLRSVNVSFVNEGFEILDGEIPTAIQVLDWIVRVQPPREHVAYIVGELIRANYLLEGKDGR